MAKLDDVVIITNTEYPCVGQIGLITNLYDCKSYPYSVTYNAKNVLSCYTPMADKDFKVIGKL